MRGDLLKDANACIAQPLGKQPGEHQQAFGDCGRAPGSHQFHADGGHFESNEMVALAISKRAALAT